MNVAYSKIFGQYFFAERALRNCSFFSVLSANTDDTNLLLTRSRCLPQDDTNGKTGAGEN